MTGSALDTYPYNFTSYYIYQLSSLSVSHLISSWARANMTYIRVALVGIAILLHSIMSASNKRRRLSAAVVYSEHYGLKRIADTDLQRQFKSRSLSTFFKPDSIDVEKVNEFLLVSVVRVIHQMGSILGVSWLPACMVVPALHEHSGYCARCKKHGGLKGKQFFDYVQQHYAQVEWDELRTQSYVHAGHCWVPIRSIVSLLKVDPSLFDRKFLNTHQLYDHTSWLFHQYMCSMEFRNQSENARHALVFLFRAWFNDFDRFTAWRALLSSIDTPVSTWADDASVAKKLTKRCELCLINLDVEKMARTLFQECCVASKQPDRGYIKGVWVKKQLCVFDILHIHTQHTHTHICTHIYICTHKSHTHQEEKMICVYYILV